MSFLSFRALIVGGGAPEIETSLRLMEYAHTLTGMDSYCMRAFAEALEVIPLTLAENAGLNPIAVVTDLRNKHAQGFKKAGINVKKVLLSTRRRMLSAKLHFPFSFPSLSLRRGVQKTLSLGDFFCPVQMKSMLNVHWYLLSVYNSVILTNGLGIVFTLCLFQCVMVMVCPYVRAFSLKFLSKL